MSGETDEHGRTIETVPDQPPGAAWTPSECEDEFPGGPGPDYPAPRIEAETGPPPAAEVVPTGPATLVDLVDRLTAVEASLGEFHRRAAHREAVIDRLHQENQELRAGIRRALLDPVVVDLIRLYDGLTNEAARLAQRNDDRVSALLESFSDDVELVLERCGLRLSRPAPGERFQPGAHVAAAVVPTADPELHNTVVDVVQVGIQEEQSGRFRRPSRTRVYRQVPGPPPQTP